MKITDEQINDASAEFADNQIVAGVDASKEDIEFILEAGFCGGVRWAIEQLTKA